MLFKRFFSLLFCFVIVLTFSNNVFANSSYQEYTVESYKDWINSQTFSRDSNSIEAQNFITEFNSLTEDEQNIFVSYLNDSELMMQVMNFVFNEEDDLILKEGDIIISNSVNDEIVNDEFNRSTIQHRIASNRSTTTILGLTVFEYSAEVRYSHNGSAITAIQHGNAWISRAFLPLASFSWSNQSSFGIGTRAATHIGYCTWSFVHSTLPMQVGTHQVGIEGTVSNTASFWVK